MFVKDPRSRQRGVGLIEVLIALLILSIGLLGIAGLQNTALRFNHNAYLDSQAQFLIRDIVERMRTSREPALYLINFGETAPAGVKDCTAVDCSNAQDLADWELAQWVDKVNDTLPNAAVQIQEQSAVDSEYTIAIRYDDLRGEEQDPANPEPMREVQVVTRI